MRRQRNQNLVKDEFREVTFWNGDSMTLCKECLDKMNAAVAVAIIMDNSYEELFCDQCSCMNSVAAYINEIDLQVTKVTRKTDGRTVI